MNTIRKEISPSTLFAEIKLHRAVHKGSFLLVEGDTDARFYRRFVDDDRCIVINCINKSNVEHTIINLQEQRFRGFLGLIDKDFLDITGMNIFSPNIIFTDGNDTDMMVVNSQAFDKVLVAYGSEEKISAVCEEHNLTAREIVAREAAKIGVMRLVSKQCAWNIKFSKMKYSFTSNSSFTINEIKLTDHILSRSGLESPSKDDFEAECKKIRALNHESLRLANGHDFVRILARALKHDMGTNNNFETNSTELERILRLAYEREFLILSSTYRDIRCWEESNPPYIVLRSIGIVSLDGRSSI